MTFVTRGGILSILYRATYRLTRDLAYHNAIT